MPTLPIHRYHFFIVIHFFLPLQKFFLITMISPVTSFNCRGRLLVFEDPIIMGILNITPDSFYAASRVTGIDEIIDKAGQMIEDGATILDLGAMSSRLGAVNIDTDAEISRLMPFLSALRDAFPQVFISVDTFRAEVAKQACSSGADIINDISGGRFDENLFRVIADANVPYVLMHNGATFESMHSNKGLGDPVATVFDFFTEKIRQLNEYGIYDIFLDPGFGFGKLMQENFSLLKSIGYFNILHLPVLAGVSRKKMVYTSLNISSDDALNGTTALNMYALAQGSKVLRVHDVKEASQSIELYKLIRDSDKEICAESTLYE